MKPIIIANWKNRPQTTEEAVDLFDKIAEGIKDVQNAKIVVCPPFYYLSSLRFKVPGIRLGSQNTFVKKEGANDQKISWPEVKKYGGEFAIIGHSSRRVFLRETDEIVNKELKEVLDIGLIPILCIGETAKEKNSGKTKEVLKRQLEAAIEASVIAYEPVWAIGSGNACSPNDASKIKLFLEKMTKSPILYGGSVDSKNAMSYIKDAGFSGLLVGGASLLPAEFVDIVKKMQ